VKPTTLPRYFFTLYFHFKKPTSFSNFPKVVKTDLNWRFRCTISVGFDRRGAIPLVVATVYFCIFLEGERGRERRGEETPCLVACSVLLQTKCLSKIQALIEIDEIGLKNRLSGTHQIGHSLCPCTDHGWQLHKGKYGHVRCPRGMSLKLLAR
jgi:hypothetical protein